MDRVSKLLVNKGFYIFLYLGIINLISFILIALDKYRAKRDKWRIKERTFFILALIGGANGIILGMTIFRHKTQHKSFYIGMPIIYLLNLLVGLLLIYYFYLM